MLHSAHAAVLVDRNEAGGVVGDPRDPATFHPGQAENRVGGDRPMRRERELPVVEMDRHRAGHDLDVALREQLTNPLARRSPEDMQRRVLGRDDDKAPPVDSPLRKLSIREQGQLVERQRPGAAARAS